LHPSADTDRLEVPGFMRLVIEHIGTGPRGGELVSVAHYGEQNGDAVLVWLHSASRRIWAVLHTMKRHGTMNVAILSVDVPRNTLRRAGRGLWFTSMDVPADRLTVEDNDDEEET
jgi:hypothetical protein